MTWNNLGHFLGPFISGSLFAIVVILVLRARGLLQPVGRSSTSRIIESMLLFAFIVAVVGMFLFGVFQLTSSMVSLSNDLATTKAQNIGLATTQKELTSKNRDLLDKISKIQEPSLKEQSGSVEILEAEIVLDLTDWKQVSERDVATRRQSLVVMRTRRRLWKAKEEFKKFPATYGTSSMLEPEFHSDEVHSVEVHPNTDPIPPNKESLRRWLLLYDISAEERFKPFDIKTEIREWNEMQNPREEHNGTLILFPTRSLTYKVIFPITKRAKRDTVRCYSYGLDATSKVPIDRPSLEWASDGSSVTWQIDDPHLLLHYEIWWEW